MQAAALAEEISAHAAASHISFDDAASGPQNSPLCAGIIAPSNVHFRGSIISFTYIHNLLSFFSANGAKVKRFDSEIQERGR